MDAPTLALAAFAAPAAFAFGLALGVFIAFARRLHALNHHFRQLAVNVPLNFVHHHVFFGIGKAHRNARAPCPPRAPDAMHIILRLLGQIIIDNMSNRRHINAPRGNIRRHQDFAAPLAYIHQRAIAPTLRHIAVQAVGGETFFV